LILFLFIHVHASRADEGGRFVSEIVRPSDQPLVIEVKKDRYVRILNFTQEGGTIDARGSVSVAKATGAAANVLAASFVGSEVETQKDLLLAGPAKISVAPVAGGNLYLAYRYGGN
ncbi:MAG: hypothetical protein ABR526_03105, partial [Chthoniobacterales bacterium]